MLAALKKIGMRRFGLAACLMVLSSALAHPGDSAGEEQSFRKKPHILWRFRDPSGGRTWNYSPLAVGNKVYTGGGDGALYALDAVSGAVVWTFQTGRDVDASTIGIVQFAKQNGHLHISKAPAQDGTYIYFGSFDGYHYALDLNTGKEAWRARCGKGGCFTSPCLVPGAVAYDMVLSPVTAFDRATGAVRWTDPISMRHIMQHINIHLASEGQRVCVVTHNEIYCLDGASGKTLWRRPWSAPAQGYHPAAFGGGRIYYVDHRGAGTACVALDDRDGSEVWRRTADGYVGSVGEGVPCVHDGMVYVVMEGLYALDASTGEVVWRADKSYGKALFEPLSRPIAAGGAVIVGTKDSVTAFDAKTGERLWDVPTGDMVYSTPAASGDRIYFGCNDAYLYCLGYGEGGGRVPAIPQAGPVSVRADEVFSYGGKIYAVKRHGNGREPVVLDFASGEPAPGLPMLPRATVTWTSGGNLLWAAGAKGPCYRVDMASGAIVKTTPTSGPDIGNAKFFSHVDGVALGRVEKRQERTLLVALDVDSGEQLWKTDMDAGMRFLEVSGNSDRVFLAKEKEGRGKKNAAPTIAARDRKSGKLLWETSLGLPVEPPDTGVEYEGTLYVGCLTPAWRSCPVYAISSRTGEIIWQAKIDGGDAHVVAVDQDALYVQSPLGGRLSALRRTDGKVLWTVAGFSAFISESQVPTSDTRPLFLQKDNITIAAVDRATGAVIAEAVFDRPVSGFVLLGDVGCAWSRTPGSEKQFWMLDLGNIPRPEGK